MSQPGVPPRQGAQGAGEPEGAVQAGQRLWPAAALAAERAAGEPGADVRAGLPPGEPRRVLEGMRFGWMIPLLVLLPVRPGGARC